MHSIISAIVFLRHYKFGNTVVRNKKILCNTSNYTDITYKVHLIYTLFTCEIQTRKMTILAGKQCKGE